MNTHFPTIAVDSDSSLDLPVAGLAVDIDEVLSDTMLDWCVSAFKHFGNPENLSPQAFIEKYRYLYGAPYFQTEEFEEWRYERKHANQVSAELRVIEGAVEGMREVSRVVPVACYITARPPSVMTGTREWLTRYDFPQAPIVYFPGSLPHETSTVWKSALLSRLYPTILGIIDDHLGLIESLPVTYPGQFFLYDFSKVISTSVRSNIHICPMWPDIEPFEKPFRTEKILYDPPTPRLRQGYVGLRRTSGWAGRGSYGQDGG